jgi:flagellar hook-associated protein 3 FlgL
MIGGVSDLQQNLLNRRQNSELRAQLLKLTQEVGSGRIADIHGSLSGNVAPLASVSNSLAMLTAYETTANQLNLRLDYAYSAMDGIRSKVSGLGPEVLAAVNQGEAALDVVLNSDSNAFESAVQSLQVRIGNRYIFSGENSSASPLVSAEQMLTALRAETAGLSDADDFFDTVDRWFTEAGNGFETSAYRGGAASDVGIAVSSTSVAADTPTADTMVLREALRDLAMIKLVGEGSFLGSTEAKASLGQRIGSSMLTTSDAMTRHQAQVGSVQEQVSLALAQTRSEQFSMNEAYNELVGVDLFDAASRLEDTQTKLESIYLITAKTSRLNLADYLR